MSRAITEDVLKGIAEALEIHAPHLLPTIHKLIRDGLVDGPEGKLGSSIYGKLTSTISWEEGEPVLRALEAIEREHGYQTPFAGRQINWLVVCWRQFAEPRQLPPQP
jgi:DNA-binding IscR family transcriptional regulator